jgi:preprotein translocase SecE subunit
VCAAFIVAFAGLCWWLMNKPTNVDFLIATDSEMKKVNWTSRRELIGSTKVVIIFMFLIAAILFLIDVGFGYLFYMVKVLKNAAVLSKRTTLCNFSS